MTPRNDKTPVAAGVCHHVEASFLNAKQFITPGPQTQPRPGTALCAYLRRFLGELDAWHEHYGDRQTQGLIDCCTVLLNEGKGGRYGA